MSDATHRSTRILLFVLAFSIVTTLLWFSAINDDKAGITNKGSNKKKVAARTTPEPSVRFVFVAGVEGTGHHLLQRMTYQSPVIEQLTQLGIYPKLTTSLRRTLYALPQSLRGQSLWGAMTSGCNETAPEDEGKTWEGIQKTEDEALRLLRTIEQKAKNAMVDTKNASHHPQKAITIPVNILKNHTMLSYPHLLTPCRSLEYPDLDIWYDLCYRANVTCEHLYIHRDPWDVVYSTSVKRHFNKDKPLLYTVHLYKSMLRILHSQLSTHASRTIGCYGMFEKGNVSQWKYQVGNLLGWTNKTAYDESFAKDYVPPTSTNVTEYKKAFRDTYLASSFKSFVQLNERVKGLCESTAQTLPNHLI